MAGQKLEPNLTRGDILCFTVIENGDVEQGDEWALFRLTDDGLSVFCEGGGFEMSIMSLHIKGGRAVEEIARFKTPKEAVEARDELPPEEQRRTLIRSVRPLEEQIAKLQESLRLAVSGSVSESTRIFQLEIRESLGNRYFLRGDDLTMLDGYPMQLRLEEIPMEKEVQGTHRGKVRGKKGRYLFFEDEDDGSIRMLDLSDLPSRHLQDRVRRG